jgi:hypothetical protein
MPAILHFKVHSRSIDLSGLNSICAGNGETDCEGEDGKSVSIYGRSRSVGASFSPVKFAAAAVSFSGFLFFLAATTSNSFTSSFFSSLFLKSASKTTDNKALHLSLEKNHGEKWHEARVHL